MTDRLDALVRAAREAAGRDSNDAEIRALSEALDEALFLLGRDDLR
jgi:ribonuclease HI